MEWRQQYGRCCQDCEFWEGIPHLSRKSKEFKGVQGTCHRLPPVHYCEKTNVWIKPLTLDSDGCGEFKRLWHVQPQGETRNHEAERKVTADAKIETKEGLISVDGIADLLGISRTSIFSMRSSGALPLPIRLGRSLRWNKHEILDWIEEGCPPLRKWEIIRKHRK